MDINRVLPGHQTAPSQNLINPVKRVTIRPEGYFKSIILDALSVFSALGFGLAYYRYLTGGLSPWFVFITLIVFSSFSALQVFLAGSFGRRMFVIFGETLAIVSLFLAVDGWEVVALAGAIVYVLLAWGYLSSRVAFKNGIEIRFFGMTRSVLGKVTTAALLVMILVYAPTANGDGLFVPRASFQTFFNWASGFLNGFYPGVPFNDTFGSFSQNLAKQELDNNPTFQQLDAQDQNTAIDQQSEQIANGLSGPNGSAPQPTEQVSDVMYNYIVNVLGSWQSHLQDKFIIGWVIVLFLILRTFGIVFVWLAQFVALILYEIFLASGFMRVGQVTETRETIMY